MLQFFQKHRSRQRAMQADTPINAKADWSLGTILNGRETRLPFRMLPSIGSCGEEAAEAQPKAGRAIKGGRW